MVEITKWERAFCWAVIFTLVFWLIDGWNLECSILCTPIDNNVTETIQNQ